MKILFLNNTLGVKQYHLASALTDKYNAECHFAHMYPFGYNWKMGLKQFPRPRKMLLYFRRARDFTTRDILKNDPTLPFKTVNKYSDIAISQSDFDWVYFSSAIPYFPEELEGRNVWVDIEDLVKFNDLPSLEQIAYERQLMNKAKILTFGSEGERRYACHHYVLPKPTLTMYPRVAQRTLPKTFTRKTDNFSIVVIDSSWNGAYFRDYYPLIEEIVKDTGIEVYFFLANYWSKPIWDRFADLTIKYDNFFLFKAATFGIIKDLISKYHVGLVNVPGDLTKVKSTFGMKPFEYAYANVQPASIGSPLIDLESQKEFGYQTTPQTIESDFKNNLVNFRKEENLMENHITELFIELSNPT
jgi:hypothetical protein